MSPAPEAAPDQQQDILAGMCASIALRDLNLVDTLLAQLEKLEAAEDNPDMLSQLYGMDHLATRLRRNAENLRVLAGQEAGGAADETATLVDVIRAALSSIEQYTRVEVGRVAPLAVVGFAADDVSRLLAELLDNATTQSPPTTSVLVSAHLTERGSVLLRLEDSGIGMPTGRLDELNAWLAAEPVLDNSSIDQMGLAVVRRLASKHAVKVWLGRRSPHGTTASVLLPADLVREAAPKSFSRRPTAAPEPEADRADDGVAAFAPPSAGAERRAERNATSLSGLPRRAARARHATTQDGPKVVAATTPSGLPRRVPQSLRGAALTEEPAQPEQDTAEGHEQFLADLGAFAEGEQAARDERPAEELDSGFQPPASPESRWDGDEHQHDAPTTPGPAAGRQPEPPADPAVEGDDHRIQLKGQISDD